MIHEKSYTLLKLATSAMWKKMKKSQTGSLIFAKHFDKVCFFNHKPTKNT